MEIHTKCAHAPERTCKGCGKKRHKVLLYRLVLDERHRLIVDKMHRAQGRGAYVCGSDCLKAAMRRKALPRAFKGRIAANNLDATSVALY